VDWHRRWRTESFRPCLGAVLGVSAQREGPRKLEQRSYPFPFGRTRRGTLGRDSGRRRQSV
jgi:hypothetical protein